MRVFLDTNVILDVALRRPGLFEGSDRALKKCEAESHEMRVSWHTLSNLFYILRRDCGGEKTVEFIRHLLSISTVAAVGHADALRAVEFGLMISRTRCNSAPPKAAGRRDPHAQQGRLRQPAKYCRLHAGGIRSTAMTTLRAAICAARENWEDFNRIMTRVPDVPPISGDER